jgi:hypothetical protein
VSEFTLGGYMKKHDRAAAFGGSDGRAYSVAVYVEDEPESEHLAWGRTGAEAAERLAALSLYDVKAALEEAIARAPSEW